MNTIVQRRLFVKPAEGRIVMVPEKGTALPAGGGLVLNDKYWRRRLADGDVVEAPMPGTEKKTQKSAKKEA